MRKSTLLSLVFLAFSASTAACSAGDTVAPAGGPLEYYAPIVLPCGPLGVQTGDVDGDGKKDLVTATKSGSGLDVLVYLNKGGEFADPLHTSVTDGSDSIRLFDVDADGRDDLMTWSSVYFAEAGGTFGKPVKASIPFGMSRFDVNGDGYPDMLTYVGSTVTAYSINGDGSTIELFKVNDIAAYPTYADLDHDGTMDIAYKLGSTVVARFGQGIGSFSQPRVVVTADMLVGRIDPVDIDGDKVTDLVVSVGTEWTTDSYVVFRNKGDGTFSQQRAFQADPKVVYRFTDATGDGRMDVVLSAGEQLAILTGNGNGTFGDAAFVTGPWSKALNSNFVDLNNDGRLDIVVADSALSVLIHK